MIEQHTNLGNMQITEVEIGAIYYRIVRIAILKGYKYIVSVDCREPNIFHTSRELYTEEVVKMVSPEQIAARQFDKDLEELLK